MLAVRGLTALSTTYKYVTLRSLQFIVYADISDSVCDICASWEIEELLDVANFL